MYRLEEMKPLLVQQHASAADVNLHQPSDLSSRLAALKFGGQARPPQTNPKATEQGITAETLPQIPSNSAAATATTDLPTATSSSVSFSDPAVEHTPGSASAEVVAPPPPPSLTAGSHGPSTTEQPRSAALNQPAAKSPVPAAGPVPAKLPTAAAAGGSGAHKAACGVLRNVENASQLRQFAPMVGIRNPGSMCYISASVAVLLRCAALDGAALLAAAAASAEAPAAPQSSLLGVLRSQASLMASAHRAGSNCVDLFEGVCARLREEGLRNTVGEEGDAQEAVAAIVSSLSDDKSAQAAAFQLETQVIWRKADGATKLLRPESSSMLHLPIPARYLCGSSATSVPLEHCLGEALEPAGQTGERFTTVVTQCPRTLLLHIRRKESITAAQTRGVALPADMPASGPDVICPDMLSLRDKQFHLRGIVAHQRLQAGAVSAAGARSSLQRGSKFAHPVQSVVVSGSGGDSSGASSAAKGRVSSATLDQGHYIALVREADSNACVLYSDSSSQLFTHDQDAMTSPLQAYIVLYEQV